ncbi:hypothetical protein [Methanobrevibacter millerae]|uniref:Uncharacterized protein n=1 Tax=Methanobrevibacter millerae TaxID=230361 RepID=A0A1G5VGU9_9EURY|nr:hypothetical protein [Methanobrevibacter millerae]SDA45092.1 hypothetical protein SAMN02910315_00597 [Methanobrevibacter millerae]
MPEDYTDEEKLFINFLNYYSNYHMAAYRIAENNNHETILPTDRGRNRFEMYALDEICKSCQCFKHQDYESRPKTTDAIWYKKHDDKFFIFLIEFKGDYLCKHSNKCSLIDILDTLKQKNEALNHELTGEINQLKKIVGKYSDKMLNGLAVKPLETVTIALPLIYEEYYNKNKENNIEHLDISNFLKNSKIIYRVVSISENYTPNRWRSRGNAYRCSNVTPIACTKYAEAENDDEPIKSYEDSLKAFHRRYLDAGIIQSADFIENTEFNNFIINCLE